MSEACSTSIALGRSCPLPQPSQPCKCCLRRPATPAAPRSPATCASNPASSTVAANSKWRIFGKPCAACTAKVASLCLPHAMAAAARDEWIGWTAERRRQRLRRVLGLSRFLIRPSVRCHLLASKVLGTVLRRLPEDLRQRHGYRPALVETYSICSSTPAPASPPPTGSISARHGAAANSTLITSTTSPSGASSSNPSARTGKPSSIVSSIPAFDGPLERLLGPLTEESSPGISGEFP